MTKAKVNNNDYTIEFDEDKKFAGVIDNEAFEFDIKLDDNNNFKIVNNNNEFDIDIISTNLDKKSIQILVNGKLFEIELENEFDSIIKKLGLNKKSTLSEKEIKAQMPGLVIDVYVEQGMSITKDQKLITLEAMKMENVIKSPSDFIIKKVNVTKGDTVEKNDILFELE